MLYRASVLLGGPTLQLAVVQGVEAIPVPRQKGRFSDERHRRPQAAIKHYIEDPLSEAVLAGRFKGKNVVNIDVQDEEHLKFEGEQIEAPEKEKREVVESK